MIPSNDPLRRKLENYLLQFPLDATSWEQASDELPELHNHLAEYVRGYLGNVWVANGGLMPKTIQLSPSLRNQYHRKAIDQLLQSLEPGALESLASSHPEFFPLPVPFDPFQL